MPRSATAERLLGVALLLVSLAGIIGPAASSVVARPAIAPGVVLDMQTPPQTGGRLLIEDGTAVPPPPYISGDSLRLADDTPTRSLVCDGPADDCFYRAILGPDGHQVLYQATSRGRPMDYSVIRVLDTRTGDDRLLATSAELPAWSADQRIAYVQYAPGERQRADAAQRHPQARIMVQASIDGQATPWTEPGPFLDLVWAHDRLLSQVLRGTGPASFLVELIALDAPTSERVLATSATLVAVSPDGSSVLITKPNPDFASPPSAIAQLVAVVDGTVLSESQLPPWLDLAEGTWTGDHVVAVATSPRGGLMHPPPGFAVVRVSAGTVAVERSWGFMGERTEKNWPFYSLGQPRFLDATGNRVGAWLGLYVWISGYLECDLSAHHCVYDTSYANGQFPENRSRPLPDQPKS